MDNPQFNVVVSGAVLDGFDNVAVLQQIQQHLKLPEEKARLLIAAKTVTVKRDITEAVANAYCSRLRALGIDAHVETSAEKKATDTEVPATTANVDARTPVSNKSAPRYFSSSQLPRKELAPTSSFKRAVWRANSAIFSRLIAYTALALFALGIFLGYVIFYADFLVVPPILFSALVYFAVSLTLAIFAALVWRPLLPMRQKNDDVTPLSETREPELFEFVTQLCEKLAIKAPAEIIFTTDTHNHASLLPGFNNIKRGEYRLALSLPQLENSAIDQYAGLLAGDIATQTYLPMLSYRWITSLTHERIDGCIARRDWLAQRFTALAQSSPQKFNRIFNKFERVFEYADRYLRKIQAHCESFDAKLLRPLLFEQDRYSALITGSTRFNDLMIYRAKLETAARDAREKNLEDRIEGGLVDDLPALVRHYFDSADENFSRTTQREWNGQTTPRSDEPPIPRERIEHIVNLGASSMIDNKTPAQSLLRQRDDLAREITLKNYCAEELNVDSVTLMPTEELTYNATQDILQRQQAATYFNDWLKPFRFWSLADYKLISDMPLQDAAMQLSVCVNEIRRLTPDRAKLFAEYERLQNQLRELLLAQHVLAAGKRFSFRYVHYDGTTLAPLVEDRQQELDAVMEKLLQQETVMGGRITLGLRLSGQDQREVHQLHDALRMLHEIGTRLYKISLDCFQLEQLLERHHRSREADYSLPIKKLETKIEDACALLSLRLDDIPYPLDNRHRSLKSFVDIALAHVRADTRSPILEHAQRLLDVLYRVNEKLSRQAADFGTIAEEAYRIEPIRLVK